MTRPALLALALVACAKTAAPDASGDAEGRRTPPGPLEERPVVTPEIAEATLSNGLVVRLVRNAEVPLFNAYLVVQTGRSADPVGLEDLGAVTFDVMDEGAAGKDAAALARTLRALGGSVSASAGPDAGWVSASGPTRNLAPILDVWADVLLRPDFPQDAFELVQTKRIAELKADLDDPSAVATRVWRTLAFGDDYVGRLVTEASYRAMDPAKLRAYHEVVVDPARALLLVGGDVTLDALVPMLEARLGAWTSRAPAPPRERATPAPIAAETVFVVDHPGAAQSVLRSLRPVMERTDDDHWAFVLGNTAFGGAFTARVNMNLREDKGWTYGARCSVADEPGPSIWVCATNVQADATVPALLELRAMTGQVLSDQPVTEAELAYFKGYRVNDLYGRYETPNALIGQLADIWTYALPADWIDREVPSLRAVTPETANAAMRRWLVPDAITWLVVGDLARVVDEDGATVRDGLLSSGLRVVQLDTDGRTVDVLAEGPAR